MPVIIENVSNNRRDSGVHAYTVRINSGPILATFRHKREDDLHVLLRLAADAVEQQRGGKSPYGKSSTRREG